MTAPVEKQREYLGQLLRLGSLPPACQIRANAVIPSYYVINIPRGSQHIAQELVLVSHLPLPRGTAAAAQCSYLPLAAAAAL